MGKIKKIKNPGVDLWLDLSGALFREMLPKGAGYEMCGKGMSSDEFGALVDREMQRVDHALVAMAEAVDEKAVSAIMAQLDRDTIIALFSRWAHYHGAWKKLLYDPHPHLWIPTDEKDLWRAILLAMTGEDIHSTEAAWFLWPELSGER
jgi:hypothetical protein